MSLNPAPLVLLIDHDADNRDMYGTMLAVSGFDVLQAENIVEALALVAERLPAVAVTDLRMPGDVPAAELCRQFREVGVPVITLTAVGPGKDHDAMRRAGCARILMKPLPPDQLIMEITRLLTPGSVTASGCTS